MPTFLKYAEFNEIIKKVKKTKYILKKHLVDSSYSIMHAAGINKIKISTINLQKVYEENQLIISVLLFLFFSCIIGQCSRCLFQSCC